MNKFKKIRNNKKLSQTEFANLLGVTVTAISMWENDKRNPTKTAILLMTFSVDELKKANKKIS